MKAIHARWALFPHLILHYISAEHSNFFQYTLTGTSALLMLSFCELCVFIWVTCWKLGMALSYQCNSHILSGLEI